MDARSSAAESGGGEAREAAIGHLHLAPQASLELDELAARIQDGEILTDYLPQPAADIAHSQSTPQGPAAAVAGQFAPATGLRSPDRRVARQPNGNFDIHLAFFNDSANEDGAGSMLVAPSRELQHHVSAHHATSRPLSPAFTQRDIDMEVATADAIATTAQDAPALTTPDAFPMSDAPALTTPDAFPMSDAPAHHNMIGLGNRLPPLVHAIPFPQHIDLNGPGMGEDFPGVGYGAMDLLPVASDERLTAFARLRFDDGSYYMHTYQIILGRNIDLAHRDMRRLAKVDQLKADGHREAAEDLLKGNKVKKQKRHAARSVISERGGIVSAPIKAMPMEYQQRRQSNGSHSLSSASHPTGDSSEEKPAERAPQDMIMQAFPEVPAQFDGHVPEDPNDCPLVPIHPEHITARTGSHGPKGISRQHAKIFYNYDQGHFCVEVLGANGLHHEDHFLQQGEIAPLDHGDHLLIGAVNIRFYLPDIALTTDQRGRQDSGSRPMSFSFENGDGELESEEHISSESEGDLSVNPKHVYHYPIDSELESDEGAEDDDLDEYEEPRPRQKLSMKVKFGKTYVPCLATSRSIQYHNANI